MSSTFVTRLVLVLCLATSVAALRASFRVSFGADRRFFGVSRPNGRRPGGEFRDGWNVTL